MIMYDVVIIGAGPCGIACSIKCANNGLSVALVECGNDYKDRRCAVDQGFRCTNCKTCNVMSGFGGSVHYGDSAKLSYYPSGKALYKKLGSDYERLRDDACLLWGVDSSKSFIKCKLPSNDYLDIKEYPICVINSSAIRDRIEHWRDLLNALDISYINTRITNFEIIKNTISVFSEDNSEFKCKKLVLATGRNGLKWLSKILAKKGIKYEEPISTIGVRFEMPKQYLTPVGKLHPDFKVRTQYNNVKYKTFCFCGGKNGGRLKFANYGEYVLLDGHVLTETDSESNYANFALLRQVVDKDCNDQGTDCVVERYLSNYIRISGGQPIFQSYSDFRNGVVTTQTRPLSVPSIKYGPVYKLLINGKEEFCHVAEIIFSYISRISDVSVEEIVSTTNVIGLELEGLWKHIITNKDFMTVVEGVYVGGDCGGETQGILQATMVGLKIGESIIKSI